MLNYGSFLWKLPLNIFIWSLKFSEIRRGAVSIISTIRRGVCRWYAGVCRNPTQLLHNALIFKDRNIYYIAPLHPYLIIDVHLLALPVKNLYKKLFCIKIWKLFSWWNKYQRIIHVRRSYILLMMEYDGAPDVPGWCPH